MAVLHEVVDASDVGFDPVRLQRLNTHYERYVDDGRLAGFQLAVTRHGHIAHTASAGHRNLATGAPVEADTLWRLYSMTKPITSVAAMMLWEEGLFELKDPVSKFLPEFGEQQVWRSGSSAKPVLDPVTEPMEVWHLLTHTAGLTYGFMYSHPVDALYRAAGFDLGVPSGLDLAGVTAALAALPLLFQPGREWNYSMSTDVVGRLIEVISGQTLDQFLRTRIFEPLGMVDTGFSVPESDTARLAALYGVHPTTGRAMALDALGDEVLSPPPAFLGGGGLVATMADYLRFADMLRRRGELDGVRLLSPRTVDVMTSNHLPGGVDLTSFARPLFSETTFDGVGFGLLGSVTIDPIAAKVPGSVGAFGWGGAASTYFWVDPVEDITCVLLTQLLPSSTYPLRSMLKQLVSQALVT